MATKLQHGDSLYQVIEKVNEIIDGTVRPGSGGGGSSGGGSSSSTNVTTSMLEAETDRATSAEQYLQDQIDIINNLIGAGDGDEENANTGEDNELQAALIMESIHAATREQTNTTNIATEVARATAAEQALGTRITDETTRAQAAEQANATAITDEATRAQAAEQNLQDQIDAIDASGLQQAIDDEVTRAQAAEQNLQDQIDAINAQKIYSTTEVWTGEYWINNKKIYRRVITGNLPAITSDPYNINTAIAIQDAEDIINVFGFQHWLSGTVQGRSFIPYNLISTSSGATYQSLNINIYAGTLQYIIRGTSSGAAYSAQPYYLTVLYTKTTD